MKDLFLSMIIVSIFLCPAIISALPVDYATCLAVAGSKLVQMEKDGEYTIISSQAVYDISEEEILLHIFEMNPAGFIITSADSDLPPVPAYSFSAASFPLTDNKLLELLKLDLGLRRANLADLPEELILSRQQAWQDLLQGVPRPYRFEQWPPEGSTPTGGWLLYNWTQSQPYNNLCPIDPVTSTRSLAGCPAVAMAQILNYHRTINDVSFSDTDDYYHNYAGRQYWIDNDHLEHNFPSFPELNTYLDTLNHHYIYDLPVSNTEKAALVFACGVAAHQVYTSSGSGTFGVNQAFQAFQKFNFTASQLLDETAPDFYEHIAQNIMEALPVHFASVTPAWDSGHNFVLDGYNTDGYFHINFGWGGAYNAWYLLPDEIPYGLTVVEGAIVDIVPSPLPVAILTGQITLEPAAVDSAEIILTLQSQYNEFQHEFTPEPDGTVDYALEIPIGNYLATASYPGYETLSEENIWLEAQQIVNLDFTLCQLLVPSDLEYSLEGNQVILTWQHGFSRLFQHFNIFRNQEGGNFTLLDTTTELTYTDILTIPANINYGYYLTAVYEQENESVPSDTVYCEYFYTGSESTELPAEPLVLRNYPNPFNPVTTIEFQLPATCRQAELLIRNCRGQLVLSQLITPSTLELMNPSTHQPINTVSWDSQDSNGKPVTAGLYLYQIRSAKYQSPWQKMVLLK